MTDINFYKSSDGNIHYISNPKSVDIKNSTFTVLNAKTFKNETVGFEQHLDTMVVRDKNPDFYIDLEKNLFMLANKYKLKRYIVEEKTPKLLRYRLILSLMDGAFWNCTLHKVAKPHSKKELEKDAPKLWEVFDCKSFDDGLKYFGLDKVKNFKLPKELRRCMRKVAKRRIFDKIISILTF